jgi:hypothetical protein
VTSSEAVNSGETLAAEARANVARVIALLERPSAEALDQSTAELAEAVARMRLIQREASGGGEPLRFAIAGLRDDLRRAGLLLRHAWEFRVCRGGESGYTRKGELAPRPVCRVRWALEA